VTAGDYLIGMDALGFEVITADTPIPPAAAESVAAVVTDNYKEMKKAADRFEKAGGIRVQVWTSPNSRIGLPAFQAHGVVADVGITSA
jgi:hypothetical protein